MCSSDLRLLQIHQPIERRELFFRNFFSRVEHRSECLGVVISKARALAQRLNLKPSMKQEIQCCAHPLSPFWVVGFVHQLFREIAAALGVTIQKRISRLLIIFASSPHVTDVSVKCCSCRVDTQRGSTIRRMPPHSAEPQAFRPTALKAALTTHLRSW